MGEAISFKVDWKTWNAKLKKLNGLPTHMRVMSKSLTIFGIEKLRQGTPRSKLSGDHLADAWEFAIRGMSPIHIQIYNSMRNKEDILRILEFGSPQHAIEPKEKKCLRFEWRGKIVFTKHVEHPGTRDYAMIAQTRADMMSRFVRLREMVVKEFAKEVEGAR
ncbi:hypothetical protein ES702_03808 [subsurface metagenome]